MKVLLTDVFPVPRIVFVVHGKCLINVKSVKDTGRGYKTE